MRLLTRFMVAVLSAPIRRRTFTQLGRTNHEAQALRATTHTRIQRDEPATEHARQCNVVGVVGLRPAELVSDRPRLLREPIRLPTPHRRRKHPIAHRLGLLTTQLAPPNHRVQTGYGLDPQERRRHQLKSPETLEADRIRGSGNRDAGVDDELQRPSRDNATAATQFGAGDPSSSFCHSGGRGSIGYISSRTSSTAPGSIRCCPPTVSACSRPSRIHRRTVPGLRPTRCAALATVSTSR